MTAKGWRKRNTHIPDATKMVGGVNDSLTTQQEQGPVAKYIGEDWNGSLVSLYEDLPLNTLLYTTPPPQQRKPLTDELIWQLVNDCTIGGDLHADKFARAIEAAHGIKENT
jgi:hypothetical protein